MKKFFKIFIFVVLFSMIFITNMYSYGISMNLEDYESSNLNESNLILSSDPIESNTNETEDLNKDNSPKITQSVTSDEDDFLTIENILSIIIIVIGILLILLGVAILIRFK